MKVFKIKCTIAWFYSLFKDVIYRCVWKIRGKLIHTHTKSTRLLQPCCYFVTFSCKPNLSFWLHKITLPQPCSYGMVVFIIVYVLYICILQQLQVCSNALICYFSASVIIVTEIYMLFCTYSILQNFTVCPTQLPFHHTELYRLYSMWPWHMIYNSTTVKHRYTDMHTYVHAYTGSHTCTYRQFFGEVGQPRQGTLGSNGCYHYCNYIESRVVYLTSLASTLHITYTNVTNAQHYLPLTLWYNTASVNLQSQTPCSK